MSKSKSKKGRKRRKNINKKHNEVNIKNARKKEDSTQGEVREGNAKFIKQLEKVQTTATNKVQEQYSIKSTTGSVPTSNK